MATVSPAHELRDLDGATLVGKLREAKEELFNLRFQSATGQLESHGRLKSAKHDIARIYTVLRERELGITSAPPVPAAADPAAAPDGVAEVTTDAAVPAPVPTVVEPAVIEPAVTEPTVTEPAAGPAGTATTGPAQSTESVEPAAAAATTAPTGDVA